VAMGAAVARGASAIAADVQALLFISEGVLGAGISLLQSSLVNLPGLLHGVLVHGSGLGDLRRLLGDESAALVSHEAEAAGLGEAGGHDESQHHSNLHFVVGCLSPQLELMVLRKGAACLYSVEGWVDRRVVGGGGGGDRSSYCKLAVKPLVEIPTRDIAGTVQSVRLNLCWNF
jgi:hypothetical protein